MKTVKEEAEEFLQSKKWAEGDPSEWVQRTFTAGVEFAQRWIPVEEELPCAGNRKEFFLIKGFYEIKENCILAFTQLSSLMSITEDGTTIWSGINDDETELFFNCVVTHWRPIEYK